MDNSLYLDGILEIKSYRAVQTKVAEVAKSCGLNTVAEWFVLSHIYSSQATRAADLAELLDVEPPFITSLISELEAQNLVEKETNPDDKRVKILSLTKEGRELVPEIEIAVQAVLDNLLEGVSKQELDTYKSVMRKIVKNNN